MRYEMNIGGIEYKKFSDLEENYEIKKATILRLVKKYGIDYKVLGRARLITDDNLLKLLEKNTKDHEERRKKQRERSLKLVKEGKLGRKKSTTSKA